jgi:anti-anti-sigma factor
MEIEEGAAGDVKVAAPKGRLDAATAAALDEKLLPLLQGGGKLVADLSGVNYISSAGLRAVLRAVRAAQAGGCALAIAAPDGMVREVLEFSGFGRLIPIRDTVEEAAAALG